MVGASGAIAGVLGAYLLLYPRANVKCLFFIIIIIQMVRIPAFIVLGFWIFGQFFSAPFSLESEGGTAYFAHIGGFVFGYIAIKYFFRGTKARIYADFEEVEERDIPFFRKNRTSGLRKKDDD